MPEDSVSLSARSGSNIDAIVLGVRLGDELHVLAERAPPADGTLSGEGSDGE
jgi:hypothetical protein